MVWLASGQVQRTGGPGSGPLQDVEVDHRGGHVRVPEEGLYRADVRSRLQEVGGEAVPERVARRAFRDSGGTDRSLDLALQRVFV